MKEYKSAYCISFLCCYIELFLICFPCALLGDFILFFLNKAVLGKVFFSFIAVSLLLIVCILIFTALINLIINFFKKSSVFVNEKFVTYLNISLDLDKIKYITLYLPEMISRNNISPQELSLYINDKEHIVIKRPSILLIAYLKKRCLNAKFEINLSKSRLITDLIVGLCVAIIFSVTTLFKL
ncbi:MAG: hypothetical protein IKM18_05870 [Clostridia bacterium]|nr:hypothetical protein [Clostridia bacterium]